MNSLARRCSIAVITRPARRAELGTVAFAAVMAMGGIRRLCGLGLGESPCHHGGPGDCAGRDGCNRKATSGAIGHS